MYMMNDREFSNRKETLHGEFYENALKYPERIALIYENEKVSYKMLRLYALRAANYMWQRGVRRNDKIVVILPRGIGQVAALLGILKSQCTEYRNNKRYRNVYGSQHPII